MSDGTEARKFLNDLHEAVVTLAGEHPDRVYHKHSVRPYCHYGPDENNPDGCIIGAALTRCGHSVEGLDSVGEATSALPIVMDAAVTPGGFQSYAPQLDWFGLVQFHQDLGETWGDALVKAGPWPSP